MANMFNTMGAPASICYNLATIFIKTSILSFYLRFAVSNRPLQIAAYTLFFIVVAYSFVMAIAPLWLCPPMKKYFDYTVPGHCEDPLPPFLVQAGVNSATDIVLLLMPVWLMWPLPITKSQKIGLSFVRLAAILQAPDYGDYTWSYTYNLI